MSIFTIVLASLVALEHLYIMYLETIVTQSDTTSRVFNMDKEELARPSVISLFKNQGIYNALVAIFLLYGIYFSENTKEITAIFLIFVIAAAVYGALTSNKSILLKQGGPAILAILSLLILG